MSSTSIGPVFKRFVKSAGAEANLCLASELKSVGEFEGAHARKCYEEIVGEDLRLPRTGKLVEDVLRDEITAPRDLPESDDCDTTNVSVGETKAEREAQSNPPLSNFSLNSLMKDAEQNNYQALQKVLNENKELINSVDQYGWSLLMVAACAGADKVVELLLKSGANPDCMTRKGDTCVTLARQKGHVKVIETIRKFKFDNKVFTDAPKPPLTKDSTPQILLCSYCKTRITQSEQRSHFTSTVHQFNRCTRDCKTYYSIPGSNRGYQMMLKEGWDGERGLGPSGQGIKLPPKTVLKKDRKGLGASKERARITHFQPHDLRAVSGKVPSKIFPQSSEKKCVLKYQIQQDKLLERSLRRELS